jgi:hypothetical protein
VAVTTGYVQRLAWLRGGPTACVWLGSTPTSTELLYIQVRSSDNATAIAFKRGIGALLAQAQMTGCELDVGHPDQSAEITSVATTRCDVSQQPMQMDAVEITQAVQDLGLSVPLVARKRTVVRVYLSRYTSPQVTVTGELALRRGPSDPPLILPSVNTTVLDSTQAGNVAAARVDATRSLNFVLPDSHTGPGALAIRVNSVRDTISGNQVAVGCERRPTVWFHASPPLRVRVLGFRYAQGNPPVTYAPVTLDFQMLLSWLGRAYPASQVVSSTGMLDATATAPFGCGDINAQLAAIRALDMSSGGDQRTHYYGLVSDGGFFMRGCAGVPSTPDPSAVGSGPTGPANWGWDYDGTYGDWYGGHELGHTFGRLHPGFCGETPDDLTRYPFANGQLANSESSFMGFDVGDPILNLPFIALRGTQWHDVMTYCNYQWLSSYTYQGIRLRLLAEDALPASSSGGGGPSPGAGGRPDERYPAPHPIELGDADSAFGGTMISVVATVNLTKRRGKFQYVHPVPGVRISGVVDRSPVLLRLEQPGDTRPDEYAVEVRLNSELSPDDDREGLIDAVIPAAPTSGSLELIVDGEVVDTFRAPAEPPAIRGIRAIEADQARELRMAVYLDRPPEEGQSYAVQVSRDRGATWQTVAVGLQEPLFTLDRTQFQPGEELQVRVLATNGFATREIRYDAFRN